MKNKKLYIVFCILIVIFSASLTERIFQNDTFALIALGRDAISNKLDGYDHLTLHEDLKSAHSSIFFEVLLYKAYESFEFNGVYIFVILLSIINGLLLFNFLLTKNNNKTISFTITILSVYFSSFVFTARPTIMILPFLLFIVISIEKILETNKNKYCILLIVSSILLINTHDVMWLIHFIFYLPYIAEHILSFTKLNKFVEKKIIIKKYDNMKKLLIVMIFDILCMFTAHSLQSIFLLMKEIICTVTGCIEISELSTVNIIDSIQLISIIIFFVLQFISKHRNRISDIFMLLGLIIFSMIGIRYGVFLYFIGSLYINKIIGNIIKEYNKEELMENFDKIILKFLNLVIIILFILLISMKNFSSKVINNYISEINFPVEVGEYIVENLDLENIRVYNHFNYGAYLEFLGIPNFIDGRAGIYYQKYGETSIAEDFIEIENFGNYQELFEKYGITHAIVENSEILNEKLYNDENYRVLYPSDGFTLYEKIK